MTMSTDARRNQAALFLKELFGDKPAWAVVMVMQAPRWHEAKAFRSWQPVVEMSYGRPDVYVGCCPLKREPGKGARGRESEAALMPAAWSDIDINGSPDGHGGVVTGHAPSRDAAMEAVEKLVRPTLVVCSGFGLQPWWLLDEPLLLRDAGVQRRAKRIVHGLQRRLEHDAGWKVDNTADLSRVLRLPGTTSTKGPEPVDVFIVSSGGPRYSLVELERLGADFAGDTDGRDGHQHARPASEWVRIIREGADSGERHERIWQLAGHLLRREVDPDVALELVQVFNTARLRPPYDEANVKRLFDGILRLEIERRCTSLGAPWHTLRGGAPAP
jgi:hypothetical protein